MIVSLFFMRSLLVESWWGNFGVAKKFRFNLSLSSRVAVVYLIISLIVSVILKVSNCSSVDCVCILTLTKSRPSSNPLSQIYTCGAQDNHTTCSVSSHDLVLASWLLQNNNCRQCSKVGSKLWVFRIQIQVLAALHQTLISSWTVVCLSYNHALSILDWGFILWWNCKPSSSDSLTRFKGMNPQSSIDSAWS